MADSINLAKSIEQPKNAPVSKKYLFMMLGHSGSGKSYFVRQLVKNMQVVRLNGDTLRIEMFGSVENTDKYRAIDPTLSKEKIFKALDYMTKQVLTAGHSVIYESNNNKRSIRQDLEEIANEKKAMPVVVWVQTSSTVAIKRVQEREAAPDARKFDVQKACETVERHITNTDEPGSDEKVIIIDGTAPFEQQYASFQEQLSTIT